MSEQQTPPEGNLFDAFDTDPLEAAPDGLIGNLQDIGSSVVRGAAQGIDETIDFAGEVGELAADGVRLLISDEQEAALQKTLSPAAQMFRQFGFGAEEGGGFGVNVDDAVQTFGVTGDKTIVSQFAGDLAQFSVGFIGAGRVLQAWKPTTTTGTIAKASAREFMAAGVAFDGHEERLSDMIQEYPFLANPITEYLASDAEDSELEGRFKMAIEGSVLGGFAELIWQGARGIRAARRGDADTVIEAAEALDAASQAVADDVPPGTQLALPGIEAPTGTGVVDPNAPRAPGSTASQGTGTGTGPESSIYVSPEQSDAFMSNLINNIKATDNGVQFNGDYDPLSDLNLDRLTDERGVREAADAMSRTMHDAMASARGEQGYTFEETVRRGARFAGEMLTSPQALAENLARIGVEGQRIPETMDALRLMAESTRKRVLRSAEAVMAARSPENVNELFQNIQIMANVQATVKGYSSNTARALGGLRKVLGENNDISKAFAAFNDDHALLSALDPTGASGSVEGAVDRLLNRVRQAGNNPRRMARVIEPTIFTRTVRVAETWYTASIMSGLGTIGVNAFGGLQENLLLPITRAIGGLRAGDREIAMEGLDQLYYTWASSFEALRIAGRAWRNNTGILEPEAATGVLLADAPRGAIDAASLGVRPETAIGRVLDGMNTITGIVFRNILFTDEMNRQMAYLGRARANLAREGRAQGLRGRDLSDYIDSNMDRFVTQDGAAVRNQDGTFALQDGIDTARATVFQDEFERGGFAYAMERAVRAVPGSRIFIAPFIRTPINIVRAAVRRTPVLNMALREVRDDLSGANGPDARAMAQGAATLGAGLYTTLFGLAASGMVTGAGPADPRARWEAEKMAGWQPFSIKVGDKYYNLSRMDPVATHLMIAATLNELGAQEFNGEEPDKATSELIEEGIGILYTSIMAGLRDKTYLQGISDLVAIVEEDNDERLGTRLEKWAGQKVAGFVPSIVAGATLDMTQNPYTRAQNDFLDAIEKRLPFLANKVDISYDILGQPLSGGHGFPTNTANFVRESRDLDPVQNEVFRQYLTSGLVKSPLPKTKDGLRLTDIPSVEEGQSVHARWNYHLGSISVRGKTLHEAVGDLINSDEYKYAMTDGVKGEMEGTRLEAIGALITNYRAHAWKVVVDETPAVQEALAERKALQEQADDLGSDPLTATDRDPTRSAVDKFIRG